VASLPDYNEKIGSCALHLGFFVGDIISRVGFKSFWLKLPGPGCLLEIISNNRDHMAPFIQVNNNVSSMGLEIPLPYPIGYSSRGMNSSWYPI